MHRYDVSVQTNRDPDYFGTWEGCVVDTKTGRAWRRYRRTFVGAITSAVVAAVLARGPELRRLLDRLPLYSTTRPA